MQRLEKLPASSALLRTRMEQQRLHDFGARAGSEARREVLYPTATVHDATTKNDRYSFQSE